MKNEQAGYLHYAIRVEGLVQGVYFRKSCQTKAQSLGLTGFVKNLNDGSVYIEVEGPEQDLNALLEWCQVGPERARVSQVTFVSALFKSFVDFTIQY